MKRFSFAMVLVFLLTCVSGAMATDRASRFSDTENHWAKSAIDNLTGRGILNGYPDGKFYPENTITRAEFASVMVKALKLQTIRPETPSFADVGRNDWYFTAAESAKYYLTGYRQSGVDYFKPERQAVREDMAVALVKAAGLEKETPDMSLLSDYADADAISANLRNFVAIAVKNNIMVGSESGGKRWFKPLDNLTRAEAAQLLYKMVVAGEEKVTYDTKPTPSATPVATGEIQVTAVWENGKMNLGWTPVSGDGFKYYKVVVSESNPSPRYPDDGYWAVLSDKNQRSFSFSSGDGKRFVAGRTYYVSITAVFDKKMIYGNGVKVQVPATTVPAEYPVPSVSASAVGDHIRITWNAISDIRLQGYKVVISQYDATPQYPDNGYLYWITDKSVTSADADNSEAYHNGDFGEYLASGQAYYISVTAVYNDSKVPGNTVTAVYP